MENQLNLLLEEAEEELQQLEQDSLGYVCRVWENCLGEVTNSEKL